MKKYKLFSTTNMVEVAKSIATELLIDLSSMQVDKFSDGELLPTINESVRGYHCFLVGSTTAPGDNFTELLLTIDALKRASAKTINVILPYYGYARQDRKNRLRVPIASKMIADILTSVGVNRVITIDLHAGQIEGYFNIPVDHIEGHSLFVDDMYKCILKLSDTNKVFKNSLKEDFLICSPDAGGVNRAMQYVKLLPGINFAMISKRRDKPNEISSMQLIGDVKNKHVIIVDDIIDTAGTLCKAANYLIEEGAKSVRAFITHPILSGKAYENIKNSTISEIYVANTREFGFMPENVANKIKIVSIAPIVAETIKRVTKNISVKEMNDNPQQKWN